MNPLLIALIFLTASVASAKSDSNTVYSATHTGNITVVYSNRVTETSTGKPDAYTGATRKNKKKK